MFKCALVSTDFSDSLQRLINFVPDLVQSGLDGVVFFHNVSIPTEREIPKIDDEAIAQAKQALSPAKEASSLLPDGKSVVVDVRSGLVIDNIAKVARCYGADLLVFKPTWGNDHKLCFSRTAFLGKTHIHIDAPSCLSTTRTGN